MRHIVFRPLCVLLGTFIFFRSYAQATEPVAQPTNLQFASVKAYSLVLSFTTTTADGYLIVKSNMPITFAPIDGTTYEKGQGLNNTSKVLYTGANNIIPVREVLENTEYFFKIFAYNGSGSNINYKQSNPLTNSVISAPASEGSYYMAIDSGSTSFVSSLSAVINNHTLVAYTSYRFNIIPAIFERDTTGGRAVVNCEYSNETTLYTPPFDFVALNYSREHALCKSWMATYPTYGSNITDYAEGADYFNLLLTKLNGVNALRSNFPLGIPVSNIQNAGEFTYGLNAAGQNVYMPKADRRGDAARAMFYEMVCYNGNGGNWGLGNLPSYASDQDQAVLKLWHQQDPPDKFERTKNEYIFSIQHNRNPFIDHPGWVECIDFDSLTRTGLCVTSTAVTENLYTDIASVFPNPAKAVLTVAFKANNNTTNSIQLFDLAGRLVYSADTDNKIVIRTDGFSNGSYMLKVSTGTTSFVQRVIILN